MTMANNFLTFRLARNGHLVVVSWFTLIIARIDTSTHCYCTGCGKKV